MKELNLDYYKNSGKEVDKIIKIPKRYSIKLDLNDTNIKEILSENNKNTQYDLLKDIKGESNEEFTYLGIVDSFVYDNESLCYDILFKNGYNIQITTESFLNYVVIQEDNKMCIKNKIGLDITDIQDII